MAIDIWKELERMQEDMVRMERHLLTGKKDMLMLPEPKGKSVISQGYLRTPVYTIKENDDKVFAKIELPGIDKKDVVLTVTKDHLEIKAEKTKAKETKGKKEYNYFEETSSFYSRIPLPSEVDENKTEAKYENGILKLIIPKLKSGKRKKIEIK